MSDGDLEALIDEVASQASSHLGRVLFVLGKVADFRGAMRTAKTVAGFCRQMNDDQRYQAVASLPNHDRYFGRMHKDEEISREITAFLGECSASSWGELATLAVSASQKWPASRAPIDSERKPG